MGQATAKSEDALEGDMRPIDVERSSTSTSTSSSTSSTPALRNALLPPPLPLTIPQDHEAAASLENFAQRLPVVVKVRGDWKKERDSFPPFLLPPVLSESQLLSLSLSLSSLFPFLSTSSFPPPPKKKICKELVAGGAAGAIAKTCVAPLERVKILFQTGRMRSSAAAGGSKSSISGTLASIARTEGPRGLFKGNGASVLRIVPYSALHFGAYEQYRAWLVRALALDGGAGAGGAASGRRAGEARRRVPAWVDLLAGSGAGATAVLATYPLDLARTRLAYDMEGGVAEAGESPGKEKAGSPAKATVRSVLRATVARHGLRGLYCGIGPTLAGILPYAGLKFYVYQSAKHAHLSSSAAASSDGGGGPQGGNEGGRQGGNEGGRQGGNEGGKGGAGAESSSSSSSPRGRPSVAVTLAFGAAAGLVAQTATYPLDVVRRQMQVAGLAQAQAARVGGGGSAGGGGGGGGVGGGGGGAGGATATASLAPSSPTTTKAMPRSTWAGLRSVWASGGLRAAFAGVSINYLKVVPSTAIGFSTYDFLKSYLGLSHNL